MFHARLESMVITDTKLFNRTGDVGRWTARVMGQFERNAQQYAPNSAESGRPNKSRANAAFPAGSLRASITSDAVRVGPRHIQGTISVNVPYALYVIRGTGPWIFSKSARIPAGEEGAGQFRPLDGGGMYLPGQPGYKSRYRQRVRGQTADPFLDRAYTATSRTHSSLRGHSIVGGV